MEDLEMCLGDLGGFRLVDDKDLGFSVFKSDYLGTPQKGIIHIEGSGHEQEQLSKLTGKKLFWLNSKGEKMVFDWLKKKLEENK